MVGDVIETFLMNFFVYFTENQERLQFHFRPQWLRIAQLCGVHTVDFKFPRFDDMGMLFDRISEELLFPDLEGGAGITEGGKDFVYMLDVFLDVFGDYGDLLDAHEAGFPFETRYDHV